MLTYPFSSCVCVVEAHIQLPCQENYAYKYLPHVSVDEPVRQNESIYSSTLCAALTNQEVPGDPTVDARMSVSHLLTCWKEKDSLHWLDQRS